MDWSRDSLTKRGFTGFVLFAELSSADVPTTPGVYVVLRPTSAAPTFIEISPAGWFKGKDPSVSVDELQRAWVPGAEVVYLLGKPMTCAGALTSTADMVKGSESGTGVAAVSGN
jgi:hypothetical protein